MKRLTELMNKYGSDKGTEFAEGHGFSEFYNDFFEKYTNPRILEIGVWHGDDIAAISEFYNGECEIYGIDIDPTCQKFENTVKNFHFIYLDQSNKNELIDFVNSDIIKDGFDIIIDDGSHRWHDQMLSLAYLNKCLKNGGIYIIEDLHTSAPWYNWDSGDVTTVDSLVYHIPNTKITEEENSIWMDNIETVLIQTRTNKGDKKSITSILTFKNSKDKEDE